MSTFTGKRITFSVSRLSFFPALTFFFSKVWPSGGSAPPSGTSWSWRQRVSLPDVGSLLRETEATCRRSQRVEFHLLWLLRSSRLDPRLHSSFFRTSSSLPRHRTVPAGSSWYTRADTWANFTYCQNIYRYTSEPLKKTLYSIIRQQNYTSHDGFA